MPEVGGTAEMRSLVNGKLRTGIALGGFCGELILKTPRQVGDRRGCAGDPSTPPREYKVDRHSPSVAGEDPRVPVVRGSPAASVPRVMPALAAAATNSGRSPGTHVVEGHTGIGVGDSQGAHDHLGELSTRDGLAGTEAAVEAAGDDSPSGEVGDGDGIRIRRVDVGESESRRRDSEPGK